MTRQVVVKGALIAKVYDYSKLTVEIAVPENEIADVREGQTVTLKARAYPDDFFHGKVVAIATSAQTGSTSSEGGSVTPPTSNTTRTVLVTTEIDNPSLLLKSEMTGQAKISCGQHRVIDLVMRRLARSVKVEFWSWW
jgi:multidrug resistance efflux pump